MQIVPIAWKDLTLHASCLHFMQIILKAICMKCLILFSEENITIGDNSHEISSPVFCSKEEKYVQN